MSLLGDLVGLGPCGWCRESWEFPLTQRDKYIRLALILEREVVLTEANCVKVDPTKRIKRLAPDAKLLPDDQSPVQPWPLSTPSPAQSSPSQPLGCGLLTPPLPPAAGRRQPATPLSSPLRRRSRPARGVPAKGAEASPETPLEKLSPATLAETPLQGSISVEPESVELYESVEFYDAEEVSQTLPTQLTIAAPSPPPSSKKDGRHEQSFRSSDDDLAELCGKLATHVEELPCADAETLAKCLLKIVPRPAAPHEASPRYWPLLNLLEVLCSSPNCVRALSPTLMRDLLTELLHSIAYCRGMRCFDAWSQLLKLADDAGAALLAAAGPERSARLSEELGLDHAEVLRDAPLIAQRLRGQVGLQGGEPT